MAVARREAFSAPLRGAQHERSATRSGERLCGGRSDRFSNNLPTDHGAKSPLLTFTGFGFSRNRLLEGAVLPCDLQGSGRGAHVVQSMRSRCGGDGD